MPQRQASDTQTPAVRSSHIEPIPVVAPGSVIEAARPATSHPPQPPRAFEQLDKQLDSLGRELEQLRRALKDLQKSVDRAETQGER